MTEGSRPRTPVAPGRLGALWRVLRGERGRTKKLRKLLVLLRPYRGRVILMFVALTLATAAALAPPYLLGKAIDVGIEGKDLDALTWITIAFVAAAAINFGGTYAQTYLTCGGVSSPTSRRCRSASTRATARAC
jgi:ABC-type multidrug transport system fused ATPase/permease subunit